MVEPSIKINPQGNTMIKNIVATTFFSKPYITSFQGEIFISKNNRNYNPQVGA